LGTTAQASCGTTARTRAQLLALFGLTAGCGAFGRGPRAAGTLLDPAGWQTHFGRRTGCRRTHQTGAAICPQSAGADAKRAGCPARQTQSRHRVSRTTICIGQARRTLAHALRGAISNGLAILAGAATGRASRATGATQAGALPTRGRFCTDTAATLAVFGAGAAGPTATRAIWAIRIGISCVRAAVRYQRDFVRRHVAGIQAGGIGDGTVSDVHRAAVSVRAVLRCGVCLAAAVTCIPNRHAAVNLWYRWGGRSPAGQQSCA
jgi:hypothetical protein